MARKKSVVATAVGVAMFVLAACGGGSDATPERGEDGLDKVTLGVLPITDVAPVYLGDELGFFKEEGIDLEVDTGQGGAAIVPGVASGQLQFGFSNPLSLLLAKSQGLDLRVVAPGDSTTGKVGDDFGAVVVSGGSNIDSAADLEGKKVAVNTLNNLGTVTISKHVRDDGGDSSKVKFVELGFPDMLGALAKGQIDAAWLVEPFLTLSKKQGARPVVWNGAGITPGSLMVATYFTSEKTAKANPELVERFANAMVKSLDYAATHEDEVRETISEFTQIDPKVADVIALPTWTTEIDENSFKVLGELAVEDGILNDVPDYGEMLP